MNAMEILKMLEDAGCHNETILSNMLRGASILSTHKNIAVSISGGSDSDIVLDIIERLKEDQNVRYIWFDTGVEYQATKDHLKYLEYRYGISIERIKAIKPIPLCCHEYGIPFLSKYVSEQIEALQNAGFGWEDEPMEVLLGKYPKARASSLRWWTNRYTMKNEEMQERSTYNISRYRFLKDFIMEHPPTFRISSKCCTYAKKKVAKKFKKENEVDLEVIGVRKEEGGIRSLAYENCFSDNGGRNDQYRPVFFYTDADKRDYEKAFGIVHSRCYSEYGFKRTGCSGCPYALNIEEEMTAIERYEPKLYKACQNIFGSSYEYKRQYYAYRKRRIEKEKSGGQMDIFDYATGDAYWTGEEGEDNDNG